MPSFTRREVVSFIREQAIPGDEVERRVRLARDPGYWASLAPVSDGRDTSGHAPNDDPCIDRARVDAAIASYRSRGWCAVRDAFAPARVDALRECVSAVRREGWPLVFAFIFDPCWTIVRAPVLDAFLHAQLEDERYQTTVRFWVHYVAAVTGASGFPPHVDGGCGHHTMSVWVPLTSATTANGCIQLVERSEATTSVLGRDRSTPISWREMLSVLRHVRALPIEPGGFLAWPHDTMHWGGMFEDGAPRLALSWEITGSAYENPDPALRAALDPDRPLPAFRDRLRWVCQALLQLRGREAPLERFVPIARRILS